MELYKEILAELLGREDIRISFGNGELDLSKALENRCYEALVKIRQILEDDGLDDPECFRRIEEIVCVFEECGVRCGGRHDFG